MYLYFVFVIFCFAVLLERFYIFICLISQLAATLNVLLNALNKCLTHFIRNTILVIVSTWHGYPAFCCFGIPLTPNDVSISTTLGNPQFSSSQCRSLGICRTKRIPPSQSEMKDSSCLMTQMIEFLRGKDDFVGQLLHHLGTSAIMDLLLRLITCIESPECRNTCITVSTPLPQPTLVSQ